MLSRRLPPRPRRGFSLIEILVVLGIIGILVAMSAGAMFRLRAAQITSNTEGTLSKLHGLMMTRWSAVLEGAKKHNTVPEALIDRCGGDRDRAASVWAYATLKNEFPTTFAEATTPIDLSGGVKLQPRGIFSKFAAANVAITNAEEQSATLLYVALTQGGNQGNAAGSEGTNQQVGTLAGGASVYKDGWGTHIAFVRNATGGEIGAAPYMKANSIIQGGVPFTVKNPLDPMGLLLVRAGNPWAGTVAMPNPVRVFMANALLGSTVNEFPNQNFLPTLVSAGTNRKFGILLGGDDGGDDNLLSYRLRREGDKGN